MQRRSGGLVLLAVLVVLAGCASVAFPRPPGGQVGETQSSGAGGSSGGASPTISVSPTTMVDSRPDPPRDRLGWEDGYWHNETLDVTPEDGLNRSELDAVKSRAMARVEYVRGLEFEQNVPVEVISREEYRSRIAGRKTNLTEAQRLHQNVKFEATFLLGENESAIQQQEANAGSNVLGSYSPSNDSITIVSDGGTVPQLNEATLAHELLHALQDQHFDTSDYVQNTEERHNAVDGIIEGDAKYVEDRYQKQCQAGWSCLGGQQSAGGGGGSRPNLGLLALHLQPYSDGPVFVNRIYQREGWAGVNRVYQHPPASTEQTIHPAKYGVDQPTNVTVEDESGPAWHVPDQGEGHIDYAQFGEAGLFVMLWYPSGLSGDVIVSGQHFLAPSRAGGIDLYNYSSPYTTGWDGDYLLPYVTADSAQTNQTGYVWRTTWDNNADAAQFERAYVRLLEYHGAERVQGRPGTFRIPSGKFADAFYVELSGTNATIVNAPTVEALHQVRAGAGRPG